MKVQVLASVMNRKPQLEELQKVVKQMNLETDAILINQCEENGYLELELKPDQQIRMYSFAERGIGRSRNNALMRADGDILLFSDEDIVYEAGYEQKILNEFKSNPKADMILFNITVAADRQTYHITGRNKVHLYNSGRYGAVSFAVKRESLIKSGVTFSLLFGGGAKYSNGEDSLFLRDFMKKGYQVYTAPVTIGEEKSGESTWFKGYNEKFFFDRGVLYHYLYGKMAKPFALRFLVKHKNLLCTQVHLQQAYQIMKKGVEEGKC